MINDRHNPINDAKIQDRACEEAEERIAKMPKSEPVLTKAGAAAVAAEIMESVGDLARHHGRDSRRVA